MIWPTAASDVDPRSLLTDDHRPAPAERPWVMLNMITSVDGTSTDADGLSGGLGGAADKQVFRAVRSLPDVIIAGARTVRDEDYGPPRTPPASQADRRARGQSARPRIAVVSSSLDLDPSRRLFSDPDARPLVLTGGSPDPARAALLAPVADIIRAGDAVSNSVDWHQALSVLRTQGHEIALVEGGANINGQLILEDLVDEVLLSVAPSLVAGTGPRMAHGPKSRLRSLRLDRVLEQDDFLFLRYLRATAPRL